MSREEGMGMGWVEKRGWGGKSREEGMGWGG